MDRIILPYGAGPQGPPARATHTGPQPAHIHVTAPHAVAKGPGDYLRAVRRRCWLALLVASTLAVVGSVVVLRQPAIYKASAVIRIESPDVDRIMASLLSQKDVPDLDTVSPETYSSNQISSLRNSGLIEDVLLDPRLQPLPAGQEVLVATLQKNLATVQLPRSTLYNVHLQGGDPAWIHKALNVWLEKFSSQAREEVIAKINNSKLKASSSILALENEKKRLEERIQTVLSNNRFLRPDGGTTLDHQFEILSQQRIAKLFREQEFIRELRMSQFFPEPQAPRQASKQELALEQLREHEEYLASLYKEAKRRTRKGVADPHMKNVAEQLVAVRDEIAELELSLPTISTENRFSEADRFSYLSGQNRKEIEAILEQEEEVFEKIQQMAPEQNRYLALREEADRKADQLAELNQSIANFTLVAETQNEPVKIEQAASEPMMPESPNRPLALAFVGLASLIVGVGLVMGLEHIDHSVRAPEQLSAGLATPLLGVIPRIRRTARLQRGGHLWTPALPQSVEADAYRNLRASLVGLTAPGGRPAVTLLVTSAKADEGKSTTALNLAGTCARSGERTLLVDVDLRKSSLGDVFQDGEEHELGLVDVLRGELPWQRTVVRTDLPNLDFLPAGDPSGVPVEILGALEMRQLLTALSGHYDRVILDGPAVLGLADCRMLGRVVDATILVVRAGANDLRPVARAKAMLDQSRVQVAGVVFNGLSDDAHNWWTNYGSNDVLAADLDAPALTANRGQDAAPDEPAALNAVG